MSHIHIKMLRVLTEYTRYTQTKILSESKYYEYSRNIHDTLKQKLYSNQNITSTHGICTIHWNKNCIRIKILQVLTEYAQYTETKVLSESKYYEYSRNMHNTPKQMFYRLLVTCYVIHFHESCYVWQFVAIVIRNCAIAGRSFTFVLIFMYGDV
jgi:hypothetical protein